VRKVGESREGGRGGEARGDGSGNYVGGLGGGKGREWEGRIGMLTEEKEEKVKKERRQDHDI